MFTKETKFDQETETWTVTSTFTVSAKELDSLVPIFGIDPKEEASIVIGHEITSEVYEQYKKLKNERANTRREESNPIT